MHFGLSLFLIALGAILAFAVNDNPEGFNVNTAGVILMLVGFAALALSAWWAFSRRTSQVISTGPGGTRETTYVTPNEPSDPTY